MDEQQRQQPGRLPLLVGTNWCSMRARSSARPAELILYEFLAGIGGVTAGVEQMNDRQDSVHALGQVVVRRNDVRYVRRDDLLLGPGEAGGHGGLGDQERVRDVGRRHAADEPQRQGDLALGGQGRVATREDQAQSVVGNPVRSPPPAPRRPRVPATTASFRPQRVGVAHGVEGEPAGHGRQPRAGPVRDTIAVPGLVNAFT